MITCPLCEKIVRSLHKRSHLVPEWMYRHCYDKKHKIIHVDLDKGLSNKRQKGCYREITCEECERTSENYDRYGSLVLTSRAPNTPEHKIIVRKDFQFKNILRGVSYYSLWENIDFNKFQRFVFACILRTHLAKRSQGQYLLIEKHFNNIRRIYTERTIVDDSSYPIVVFKYPDDGIKDLVYLPYINRGDGHHVIDFAGGGYSFWVFVSSHKKPSHINSLTLKKNGSMYVIQIPFEERANFRSMSSKLSILFEQYSRHSGV